MKDDDLVEYCELPDMDSLNAAIRRMCAAPPNSVTYCEKLHQEREARRKERRKKNKVIRRKLKDLDERFFKE